MSDTIQVKGVPRELREMLETSAKANFRSLNQEALARIALTFDLEQSATASQQSKWIEEGLRSPKMPHRAGQTREIALKALAERRNATQS